MENMRIEKMREQGLDIECNSIKEESGSSSSSLSGSSLERVMRDEHEELKDEPGKLV
jgi:hypothetical protein